MTDLEMNAPVSQTEMKNELGKRPTKLTVKALQAKMMWQQKERNSRIKKLYKLTKEVEQIMKSNKRVSDGQEKYAPQVVGLATGLQGHQPPLHASKQRLKELLFSPKQLPSKRSMSLRRRKSRSGEKRNCLYYKVRLMLTLQRFRG